jgi:hypothetical protein
VFSITTASFALDGAMGGGVVKVAIRVTPIVEEKTTLTLLLVLLLFLHLYYIYNKNTRKEK